MYLACAAALVVEAAMRKRVTFGQAYDEILACAKSIERLCDIELKRKNLTGARYAVLRAIEEEGSVAKTQSDVLRRLSITQPTLSIHLKALGRLGLVKSKKVGKSKDSDSRERIVSLTPAAVGVLKELAEPHMFGMPNSYFPKLTKELKKVREVLEKRCEDLRGLRVRPKKEVPDEPPPPDLFEM